MDYYKEKQFIAHVDKDDKILGKIEKWEAHQKAILHRAFTMVLYYKNQMIMQHRKHPVFDGYFDLSFSSHQIFVNDKLENDSSAIYKSLNREWNLGTEDLISAPKKIGEIYYKAKDPQSEFSDHEIDYIFEGTLKKLPSPSYDFCYGYKLIDKLQIEDLKSEVKLAPWVNTMIEEKIIK